MQAATVPPYRMPSTLSSCMLLACTLSSQLHMVLNYERIVCDSASAAAAGAAGVLACKQQRCLLTVWPSTLSSRTLLACTITIPHGLNCERIACGSAAAAAAAAAGVRACKQQWCLLTVCPARSPHARRSQIGACKAIG
jgi:hypothetical protein